MRLLFLIHQPYFAGPHNHALRLAKILAANGVETTVLLPDEPGDAAARLRSADLRVITYPSSRPRHVRSRTVAHLSYLLALPRNIQFVRKVIREYEIDLVQVEDVFHPHGSIAARLERRPVVLQVGGAGGSLAARSFGAVVSGRLATVIMTNGTGLRAAYPRFAWLRRQIVSYFSPVDVSTFMPNSGLRNEARTELGFRRDELTVGYIARLHPEKDHFTFLRAASLIHKRFPFVRFVMLGSVGTGCEGYVSSLWQTAAANGLQPGRDVVHRDAGANVAHLAQAFDIYWSTGVNEGATTSIGEAMALALPVICTESGSVREMIQEGVTGFVVGSRKFEELSGATVPLIENDSLRKEMGRSARARAVRLFSLEVCAAKHLENYDYALVNTPRAAGRIARAS
jgi:glycosyltransferase involved in cell wall biosynthesis